MLRYVGKPKGRSVPYYFAVVEPQDVSGRYAEPLANVTPTGRQGGDNLRHKRSLGVMHGPMAMRTKGENVVQMIKRPRVARLQGNGDQVVRLQKGLASNPPCEKTVVRIKFALVARLTEPSARQSRIAVITERLRDAGKVRARPVALPMKLRMRRVLAFIRQRGMSTGMGGKT